MTILCKEVWIRFRDQNRHGQRICSSEVTAAYQLAVTASEHFIIITYLLVNKVNQAIPGLPVKVLCFNKNEVTDFACEHSLSIVEEHMNKVTE